MHAFELAQLLKARDGSGNLYLEFLRVPSMSAGIYELPAGGVDPQKPHAEDEIYYVIAGVGWVRVGEVDQSVGPGSIIFVPARVEHRFHSIESDLTLLVFFAPPESR